MTDKTKYPGSGMIGGFYAKAKQRVLNTVGRSTTLTKNPKVDSVTKRVEDIRAKKSNVSLLAREAKLQVKNAKKTMTQLDDAMISAYKAELGDPRAIDEGTLAVERVLSPEEKKFVNDLERTMARCTDTMNRVLDAYLEHLEDLSKKSLTFSTPDEQSRFAAFAETKKKYNKLRTTYSDQMIDADTRLADGKDISESLKERMDETKVRYDEISERVIEDGQKCEAVYREELAQRVAAHFTAEQQLLRGVGSAMKDLYPMTRGLTLKTDQEVPEVSWE